MSPSKIARLSHTLRDELNHRLESRVPLGLIAAIAFITYGLMRLAVLAGPQVERALR